MKLPAIRACIGDWVYYVAAMRFKDVSQYVKKVDNELHRSELLRDMLQRSITKNYESIAHYIKTQQERFFNALVLAIYDGDPIWHEVRLEYDDGAEFYNLGILELNGEEKIFPVDGQHRVEGIKKVVSETQEYDGEQIPVIFIGHKTDEAGMQRSRRLFSTLNRYAKPVSMRDIIALDEDDVVAIVSRNLIDNHPLFSNKRILDSKTKAIPEANTAAFTTIITFYECNYELLWLVVKDKDVLNAEDKKVKGKSKLKEYIRKRPCDTDIEKVEHVCEDFWTALPHSFTDIQNYVDAEPDTTPYRNRNGGNILFRPAILLPFVKAVVRVAEAKQCRFEEIFAMLPTPLLSIDNIIWRNVVWNRTAKTMIMNHQKTTERILLYYLDKTVMTDNELLSMKGEIQSLREIENEEDIDQLLEDAILPQ